MSIPNPSLPGIRQPLLDGSSASRPFYLFWQWAATNLPAVAARVDDLTVKVDSLSSQGGISPDAGIRGFYSIITQGTLAAGIVQIGLQGDVASPGFTQYYGSDTTGAKGWFNVSDTLAVTSYLTKTVTDTGATTFDLADAGNTASGTLQAITVDAKGRVTGTRDATIMGTDGHIAVANGNASAGRPTIDLDAAMVALIDFLVAVSPSPRVTSDGSYRVTDSGAYRVTA